MIVILAIGGVVDLKFYFKRKVKSGLVAAVAIGMAFCMAPTQSSGQSLQGELLQDGRGLAAVLGECKGHAGRLVGQSIGELQRRLGKEMTPREPDDISIMLRIVNECSAYLSSPSLVSGMELPAAQAARREANNTLQRLNEISRTVDANDLRSLEARTREHLQSPTSPQSPLPQPQEAQSGAAPSQQNQEAAQATAVPIPPDKLALEHGLLKEEKVACQGRSDSTLCRSDFLNALKYRSVRLSPDGVIGVVVDLQVPGFCGSGGCSFVVLKRDGSEYQNVFDGFGGLKIDSTTTNGFYDIEEVTRDSESKSAWSGTQYVSEAKMKSVDSATARSSTGACNPTHNTRSLHVAPYVIGESVCDSMQKAGIPISKLPELEENKYGLTPPSTSDLEEMVEKLFRGSHEAYNLVFSAGPPSGILSQVWVITKTPYSVERAGLVAKYGAPAQETLTLHFGEIYREATWVLRDNTAISLVEDGVQNTQHGFMKFTRILYLERD